MTSFSAGDLATLFVDDGKSASRIEAYFDDHYGFRSLLIRSKNQVDYSLFRYSEKLVIGKDDYLFYRSHVDYGSVELERVSHRLATVVERLEQIAGFLNRRGIRFVVIPLPLKQTVYPERLPPHTARRPNPNAFERYLAALQSAKRIHVVNALQVMREHKHQIQLFPRTDFHWTTAGAYVVEQAFLKALSEWMVDFQPELAAPTIGRQGQFQGRQSFTLATLTPPVEEVETVVPLWETHWRQDIGIEPFFSTYTRTSEAATSGGVLPIMVFYGDSFSAHFFDDTGLPNNFARIYFDHHQQFRHLVENLPEEADLVVLMTIESALLDMIRDEAWWPKLD